MGVTKLWTELSWFKPTQTEPKLSQTEPNWAKLTQIDPNQVNIDMLLHIINYSWDLSNLWRSGRNDKKLGNYSEWSMLSPHKVIKYVSDTRLINLSSLIQLWRIVENDGKFGGVVRRICSEINWGIVPYTIYLSQEMLHKEVIWKHGMRRFFI